MTTLEGNAVSFKSHALRYLFVMVGLVAVAPYAMGQGATTADAATLLPVKYDPAQDLPLKITQPFTFAAVGDILMRRPVGSIDPAHEKLAKIMREADMTFANLEGPLGNDGERNPDSTLDELKRMGIDMVTTANNHGIEEGIEGIFNQNRMLAEAGIAQAGSGKNLAEARRAATALTPKGLVAGIGIWSVDHEEEGEATNNRPGMNFLKLNVSNVVTAEQMQSLKQIRDSVFARRGEVNTPLAPVSEREPADRLQLFGSRYKVGPKPGDLSYAMNPADLRGMIASVRGGKQMADFMAVGIHVHQNSFAFQAYSHDSHTPDFLIDFAHQMIDNGADVFVAHGVHTLRGIEIYKGKPIFYGLSNFFIHNGPTDDVVNLAGLPSGAGTTRALVHQPDNKEALLTTSHYDKGKLVEVRIYPADLGRDGTWPSVKRGNPVTPSPEAARQILEKMQALSAPFGTQIEIQNGIGVIKVR